ncbi:MAG: hypothetical protein J0H71_05645 [Rhizobiales bacterium]|nr:hypothetical protein [Hyphomicrobiales bacterium]
MNVYFATTTQLGFGPTTEIAFSFDLSEFQMRPFRLTELPAILAFATELVSLAPKGTTLTIHSRRNKLRDAFKCKWIERWIADGFAKQPATCREEWANLHQMMRKQETSFEFESLDQALLTRLRKEFSSSKPRETPIRPAPGDPYENPWRRDTDVNDAIDRAIKKKR